MSDSARSRDQVPDADAVRALVLSLLDRIEGFATSVIADRDRGGASGRGEVDGFAVGPADPRVGDRGFRISAESILGEIGDFLHALIAAIISVLEAISAVLDETFSRRASTASGSRRSTGFQTIEVDIDLADGDR
ncbi:hypothetical protein [Williamsia sp. CHRR-6]|uniref:hypothetical protein n=1 Tax=Williamsia sp. CHRR-6 TaxID=2835871 RepID=UPI001BDA029F|nr:hypothetical protein [Williamsia sp. CHRR-6]MBT0565289.1 hypothetical protein [Williamsia sp. CHRR-6]